MSGPGERRVLLLIDLYLGEDGGTEGQVAALLRGLPAPWAPRLWALRDADYVLAPGRFPCPTRVLDLPTLRHPLFLRRLRRVAREIRAEGVAVVHAFMADGALYAPLLARWAGVPVITSRRDMGYWQTPRKLDFLRVANRMADLVLANAKAVAARTVTEEWVPPGKLRVVANAHAPARFDVPAAPVREALGLDAGTRLVGLVANFRPIKRQADLVEALAALGPGFEDVNALFLGQFDDGGVAARAEALGLAGRVHVRAPGLDVVPWIRALDVGVLCSQSEGLSNAILESMACGLPVVASDVGGNPDLVVPGETGLLYPPGDVAALAGALREALGDEARRRRWGAAGRARFAARFTAPRMLADTAAVYAEALALREPLDVAGLEVTLLEEQPALEALGPAWDALLQHTQFFLSPAWASAAWADADARPCVPVVRDAAGALVGLMPLERHGREVAFPGQAFGPDHLDVVARPGFGERVARLALDALRAAGVRRARLAHVTEDGALRRFLHRADGPCAFSERLATVAYEVEAGTGAFDAYLAARFSRSARNRFRRHLRRFQERVGAAVEWLTTPDELEGLLDRVLAIHGAGLGETSTFATPAQRAFHARLLPALATAGRAYGAVLAVEGKDLAIDYGFRLGGRLYGYQSGTAPDAATPSPGTLLTWLVLRDRVFGGDAACYDFLDGDEDYKRRWKTGTRRLYDLDLDLARPRGGTRAVLRAARTLLKEELKRRLRRG